MLEQFEIELNLPKETVGRVRAVLIVGSIQYDKEDDDQEGDDKKDDKTKE